MGIIGGKPNHAHYFIGCIGDDLLFLDPHTSQPIVRCDPSQPASDSSYHCSTAGRLPITRLDPSIALGFYCRNEEEVEDLCRALILRVLRPFSTPMFEVHQHRPQHWQPFRPYVAPLSNVPNCETDGIDVSLADTAPHDAPAQPYYDSDEFELV